MQGTVDDSAKYQVATNPHNTVFDVKRLIGRRFNDLDVQSDMKLWPFTVVCGDNDKPLIQVEYKGQRKDFAAEEISSMRKATKYAAVIAGLNVMRIVNEPTAATIAYGFSAQCAEKKTILIFDLGGGTFDVSILTVESGKFEVKVVGGDMHLGGEGFDNRMLNYCVQQFERRNKKELSTNAKALRRLRLECERAKRSLSSTVETVIDIDSLYEGLDFHIKIARAKFEALNAELFEKCMKIVKQCLEDAKLSKEQIEEVVLVGGSTRIPKLQELLQNFFDGKKLCKSLNPDEVVAHGAALQAANLNEEIVHLVLMDVTPLSLGIEVRGDVMAVVVPRNTPIPTRREGHFTTLRDSGLFNVSFNVYEGERAMVVDNNLLGQFILWGIQASPFERPQLKAVFEVDVDGILKVSAEDERRGVSNQITIANDSGRLKKDDIARMLGDAERFRREDEEAKKRHIARENLATCVYNVRSRVKEAKIKGSITNSENMEQMLHGVEEWLDENDSAEVEELEEKLKALKLKCRQLKKKGRFTEL
eukprot:PITA_17598